MLMLAAAVVFASVCVALLAYVVAGALAPERTTLRQLHLYDQSSAGTAAAGGDDSLAGRLVAVVSQVAAKRGFTGLVAKKLERAALPLRASEAIFFHLLGVVTVGLVARVLGVSMFANVAVIAVAAAVPLYALEVLARKRQAAFAEQLPDVLSLLAGSMRAGYGLVQSIDLIVTEMLPPASVAFARVQREARLGLSVEDALGAMADRLDSDDTRWVVSAINIQREVGGNLAEVLDIVAGTIRERDQLRRQVSTLTAEGRLSGVILALLPFVVAGFMFLTNREYMMLLFTNPFGRLLCAGGVLMLLVGIIWIRQASIIEV